MHIRVESQLPILLPGACAQRLRPWPVERCERSCVHHSGTAASPVATHCRAAGRRCCTASVGLPGQQRRILHLRVHRARGASCSRHRHAVGGRVDSRRRQGLACVAPGLEGEHVVLVQRRGQEQHGPRRPLSAIVDQDRRHRAGSAERPSFGGRDGRRGATACLGARCARRGRCREALDHRRNAASATPSNHHVSGCCAWRTSRSGAAAAFGSNRVHAYDLGGKLCRALAPFQGSRGGHFGDSTDHTVGTAAFVQGGPECRDDISNGLGAALGPPGHGWRT
mmetsp:Transcript_47537/g.120429  ORF Transcript_47537/g.120429 Transcript_47537/m.120429 type:complete len:281 (+) Transcript_47537:225-1067(+)